MNSAIACNTDLFTLNCESEIEAQTYGLTTITSDYFEGSRSCTSATTQTYTFPMDGSTPAAGLTITLNIYVIRNKNYNPFLVTTEGNLTMQFDSSVKTTGADGNKNWRKQTYTYTFAPDSTAEITGLTLVIQKNDPIDNINININTTTTETVFFRPDTPTLWNETITGADDLGPEAPLNLVTTWSGKFQANDSVVISFIPNITRPDVEFACENVSITSVTPDPNEASGASFSIQCESGYGTLSDRKFMRITNNTSTNYCFPIAFEINADYYLDYLETIRSESISELFSIRSLFD